MLNFPLYTPFLTGPIVFFEVHPLHAGGWNDTRGATKSLFAKVWPTTRLKCTVNMAGDCAINLAGSI
jgi:hypothetical protein